MRPIIPALQPIYAALAEPAYALLRLTAGGFLIPHGMWKLFGITGDQGAMVQFFASIGLQPAMPLVIAVGLVELIGGSLVTIGLLTRPAALAAAITTGTAAVYFHLPNGFYVDNGGTEFASLWAVVLLFVAIRGGGAISVDRAIGREI
jgi:putative oxidoreductase